MKLSRPTYQPCDLVEFYSDGLTALGALCERTWHDRLEVVAEGQAAQLWNPDGTLHEIELQFAPANATAARDPAREVFPGCPLTFHLAEALRTSPLPLERFVLSDAAAPHPPDATVAEKLWRNQFPDTTRWQPVSSFAASTHFSLLALVRCEIQAIDQHWSLHRVAVSLSDGQWDDDLARDIPFHVAGAQPSDRIPWPAPDPGRWNQLLRLALERELAADLRSVRARQEQSLLRDLERIDDYFEHYTRELAVRGGRGSNRNASTKTADRLAAVKAEHTRRRADQEARHEIRVHPQVDGLLLVAETSWKMALRVERSRRLQSIEPHFIPRSRRWSVDQADGGPVNV